MEYVLSMTGWCLLIVSFYYMADLLLGFFLKYTANIDKLIVGSLAIFGLILIYQPQIFSVAIVLSLAVMTVLIKMNTLSKKLYLKSNKN